MTESTKELALTMLRAALMQDPTFVGEVIETIVASLRYAIDERSERANMLAHAFACMVASRPLSFVKAIQQRDKESMLRALKQTGLSNQDWYQKLAEALNAK